MKLPRQFHFFAACALWCAGLVVCLNGASKPGSVRLPTTAAPAKTAVVAPAAQAAAKTTATSAPAPAAVAAAPIDSKHELHFNNELQLSYANVTGPGKAASSYTPGFTYWNAFSVSGKGNFGGLQYTHSFRFLFSDDPKRNNGSVFNFDQGSFGIVYRDVKVNGGDFYESYSQYTNRTKLMGANFSYAADKKNAWQVRSMFGYAYARWDEIWRSEDLKVKQRQVAGVNLRKAFSERVNLGLSYMRTDDSQRMIASDALNDNNIVSLTYDVALVPNKIKLSGESAGSFTTVNPNASATQDESLSGLANRVQLTGNFAPHTITTLYERVDPDFRTLTGAAATDQEKVNMNWGFKTSPVTQLTTNFLWYQDFLNAPARRTQTYRPQLSMSTSKLFARKSNRLSANIALEQKNEKHKKSYENIYANLSYGDTLFGFLDTTSNFGLTQLGAVSQKTDTDYTFRQVFGVSHSVNSNLVIKPTLNFGSIYAEDQITNDINKQFDYSMGLAVDMPKSNLSTVFNIGQNRFISDRVDDSKQFFVNININYKPQSIFGWKTNASLFVRALMNNFDFENKNRSFRESNITVGVSIPLDMFYGRTAK